MATSRRSRSKNEMLGNIRSSIMGSERATDAKKESDTNIEMSKSLTQVSISLEKFSGKQEEIFEEMIEELKKIPKSWREREKQNEDLQKKLIIAIVALDKRIEESSSDEEKAALQAQRGVLKGMAGGLEGERDARTPRNLGEAIGQKYGVNLEAMREAGGGLKGMAAGFKTNLKTGLGILRHPFTDAIPKARTLDERIEDEKTRAAASEEIDSNFRKEAVRARLEGTPEHMIAQKDPETGDYYRTSIAGNRINMTTAKGKLNSQFDPGGLGTPSAMILDRETGLPIEPSSEDEGKKGGKGGKGGVGGEAVAVLQGIAVTTKEIKDILKDAFVDKNENVDPAQEGLAASANAIESGSGSDIESAVSPVDATAESAGGAEQGGTGGGGGILPAVLAAGGGSLLKKVFTRGGTRTAAKAAGKAAAKKAAAKAVGKSLLKKIPLIGAVAGIGFGIHRAMRGDFAGALGEVASGVASTIPGVGTAASLAIDAGLAARDVKNSMDEDGEAVDAETEAMPAMPSIPGASQMAAAGQQASAEVIDAATSNAGSQGTTQNITNNYNTTNNNNNVAPQTGGQSSTVAISVRDTRSSIIRFQDRRTTRTI